MTYDQTVLAFAFTRLAILIGVGLLLTAGARRWRDDRAVAGLLCAAGVLLLLRHAAEFPTDGGGWGRRSAFQLWVRRWPGWEDELHWALFALLPASAACGLGAAFLRRRPEPGRPESGRPASGRPEPGRAVAETAPHAGAIS
ncbi:hypothetical protein [Alienimonas sp. DA493]|uniref:hypothetical protein n=1 Tax=Alienimonas sp. DA493 TaxID=3373605 RepID=UPI003754B2BF